MSKVVILDTNVLLADPNALLAFPNAEVIIPEPVLGELDKLKTARVDPDLRFRGREVSRLLFELSEDGSLIDGVELPDGGSLRVATLIDGAALPDGLSLRQNDDKILATAYQLCSAREGCDITLVTNDLNMLLKAQTLDIPVQRHGDGVEGNFARRYIVRPFQRYRVPIGILAIAVAVFAAIVVIVMTTRPQTGTVATLPPEFKQLLTANQQTAFDSLVALQSNPEDPEALLAMGKAYFALTEQARSTKDPSGQLRWAQPGIRYFERYLRQAPGDNNSRADYATMLFYSGQTDRAIQEIGKVLENDPNHVNANYNLGVVLLSGRRDLQAAREQFGKVMELVKDDPDQHSVLERSRAIVAQIDAGAIGSTESTQGAVQ